MNWYKKESQQNLLELTREIINLNYVYDTLNENGYHVEVHKINNFNWYGDISFGVNEKVIRINLTLHPNIAQLIDTISHELAHIFCYNHDKEHTKAKMCFKKIIKLNLQYPELRDEFNAV